MRQLPALALLYGFGLIAGFAQNINNNEAIRNAMDAAIAKQRESIVRQAQSIARQAESATAASADASDDFFFVPWPKPVTIAAVTADCAPLARGEVDRLASEAASREDVSFDLVRAVMQHESGFRPCAVSTRGAQGLMQLMPATAADLQVSDPFDPRQNVTAGARYLKQLLERYGGDLERALAAYNAGPGRVDRAGGVPPIPETQNYVSNVLNRVGAN